MDIKQVLKEKKSLNDYYNVKLVISSLDLKYSHVWSGLTSHRVHRRPQFIAFTLYFS